MQCIAEIAEWEVKFYCLLPFLLSFLCSCLFAGFLCSPVWFTMISMVLDLVFSLHRLTYMWSSHANVTHLPSTEVCVGTIHMLEGVFSNMRVILDQPLKEISSTIGLVELSRIYIPIFISVCFVSNPQTRTISSWCVWLSRLHHSIVL